MNLHTLPERKGKSWAGAVTHCIRGHEYTPTNTMINGDGYRSCRQCYNARRRRAH